MGKLFNLVAIVETLLSLWDRIREHPYVAMFLIGAAGGGGGVVTWLAAGAEKVNAWGYGPLGWVFVGLATAAAITLIFYVWAVVLGPSAAQKAAAQNLEHGVPANLKPLFAAFEQHAIEENELSRSCAPANKNAGILLADDDRIRLRGLLEKIKEAVNGLRLVATEKAVDSALRDFSNRLDRGTAYAKYHGVREALFDEVKGSKHIVFAP